MTGRGSLSRAEREIAATETARIYGCDYCIAATASRLETTRGGTLLQTNQLSAGWATTYVLGRPFHQVTRFQAAGREALDGASGGSAAVTSTGQTNPRSMRPAARALS